MAPATVDECMTKIHVVRHRQRQSYHKMVEALSPLIVPLDRFQGAINIVCQMNPQILSPVWGPICAVITVGALVSSKSGGHSKLNEQLASDRLATLQTLSRFLERLVEPLKRFQTYENVFSGNPALQAAIGALYCDLIDFCTRTVRFFGKSSVRKCTHIVRTLKGSNGNI
jgi:hypothetical protein